MLFIDDIHNSLGWSSQYDTCSNNIVLRRTRSRRYYGFLFFGECAMVCHLPRQVGDFAALVNYSDLWFSCMFANDIKVNYNFAGNNVPLCFRSIDHCTGMMTPLHSGASSAWLSFCDASPPVTGGFPSQRTIQMGIRLFCWEHQQAVKRTIRLLVILPVMMQLRLHSTYFWLDFIQSTLSVLRKQFMYANTEE